MKEKSFISEHPAYSAGCFLLTISVVLAKIQAIVKNLQIKKKKVVFVGVSGGVDSSVSAALLKDLGYEVFGVFIKVWQPDFITCTWREEKRDAMRVCAHLDIPFIFLDLEKEYKEGVADYMINEYKAGRTPNPDVMCNKEVKFGAFLKWALLHGADYIATGHYARNEELRITNYELKNKKQYKLLAGKDQNKDQSYFLWTLTQEKLNHVLFPVGNLTKPAVRKLAGKFGLPTAEKKDSQGVCFLGKLDMKDFLKHYIKEKKGNILDEKGKVIGTHNGALFYTLGERHGFEIIKKGINDKPYYVVGKDILKNTLIVSQTIKRSASDSFKNNEFLLEGVSITNKVPVIGKKYHARIRYRQVLEECVVLEWGIKTAKVHFKNPQTVASGQSLVLYDKYECLGGGIVV
ncbi:MAG: tRNA 2-thiouridine(34) synthase MnmA [Candidatus Paceibacterota bacterium]